MRSMALRLDDLWRDLRLAARGLWRSPRFTAAVLTLAIGTGATTALFSVVDAVLIRPLPYPDSDRIVRIRGNGPQAFILFGGPRHFQLSIPELAANGAIQYVGVYQVGGASPSSRLRSSRWPQWPRGFPPSPRQRSTRSWPCGTSSI